MATDASPEWPWDRLLVFALGCMLASVGSYVVIFHLFQESFGIDASILPNAVAWGTLSIIVGIILMSTPWFKAGPLARRWSNDEE